jgi:DNA-binding beta-propeller fold protein YncE
MLLKPDGGELYVLSPEAHGLQVINTWTHEVGDYVLLGSAPMYGALLPDASELFVSDNAADRIAPLDVVNRKVLRPILAGRSPTEVAFDSNERPSLLLVLNQASEDLSVIRISTENPGLLTMIPLGDQPKELAVKLFQ